MLKRALSGAIPAETMESALAQFDERYQTAYCQLLLKKLGFKLGFERLSLKDAAALAKQTVELLQHTQFGYHDFFYRLTQQFSLTWREAAANILQSGLFSRVDDPSNALERWCSCYHDCLARLSISEMKQIPDILHQHNPKTVLLRPEIEAIWEPIVAEDNWQPFYTLLKQIAE